MKTKIFLITVMVSLLLTSCSYFACVEECICEPIKLQIYYNFDQTTGNCFPLTEQNNFREILYNANLKETTRSFTSPFEYNPDNYKVWYVFIWGELKESKYNDYTNVTFYIKNEKLGYVDSITDISYNYSKYWCDSPFCNDLQCKNFIDSTITFKFNNKTYKLSDMPIVVNYTNK